MRRKRGGPTAAPAHGPVAQDEKPSSTSRSSRARDRLGKVMKDAELNGHPGVSVCSGDGIPGCSFPNTEAPRLVRNAGLYRLRNPHRPLSTRKRPRAGSRHHGLRVRRSELRRLIAGNTNLAAADVATRSAEPRAVRLVEVFPALQAVLGAAERYSGPWRQSPGPGVRRTSSADRPSPSADIFFFSLTLRR